MIDILILMQNNIIRVINN